MRRSLTNTGLGFYYTARPATLTLIPPSTTAREDLVSALNKGPVAYSCMIPFLFLDFPSLLPPFLITFLPSFFPSSLCYPSYSFDGIWYSHLTMILRYSGPRVSVRRDYVSLLKSAKKSCQHNVLTKSSHFKKANLFLYKAKNECKGPFRSLHSEMQSFPDRQTKHAYLTESARRALVPSTHHRQPPGHHNHMRHPRTGQVLGEGQLRRVPLVYPQQPCPDISL